MRGPTGWFALAVGLTAILALASCASPTADRGAGNHPKAAAGSDPGPTLAPPPDPIAGMSLEQQVGQLFMVGTTATAAESVTLNAITTLHVGNVFLSGRSHLGVAATAAVVARLRARATADATNGVPLLVATDQEGGEVQVLQGPGFAAMPTGLGQSRLSHAALATAAARWGGELSEAGVNMNLAPVVDLLDSPQSAATNPPIGVFQRELGFSTTAIESHAGAFRTGMSSAHVVTVLKHFPGLGHVTQNTDTSRGVVDRAVTSHGPDIAIYKAEIADGARCIMVSSAVYARIDSQRPAVFSSAVVTGLLRNSLGFTGVVITDDLSGAAQTSGVSPANRAIDSVSAGVDIVLVSSSPEVASAMVAAVLARAKSDPAFAAKVAAAARRVVELKNATLVSTRRNGTPNPRFAH